MRSLARYRSWMVALGVSLCPALASAEDAVRPYPACDRTPTPGDVASAKGAFEAGNGSFNEADYDRAITYWEDAYRRDCTAHPLLLNLARAYELNNQKQHAVNALQTFVARVPNSSEENQIKRRIDKLQEQIQSEAASTPPPATTTTPTPTATPAETPPPNEATPPPEAPKETASSGGLPIWPIVVAGAGLVMMTTGGIIWLGAKSELSDIEGRCPTHMNCDPADTAKGNDTNTRLNISGAFALVGMAALVGGGVWFFLENSSSSSGTGKRAPHGFTASVTPAIAPGYGGMTVAGSF
jgi:hypothetical protein